MRQTEYYIILLFVICMITLYLGFVVATIPLLFVIWTILLNPSNKRKIKNVEHNKRPIQKETVIE